MAPRSFTLSFLGDVMLGRLIDQLMPVHVNCPAEAQIVSNFVKAHPQLHSYGITSPWGTTLPLLLNSDLRLINLETAVTTHDVKWPNKVFNYRMHPANVGILNAAKIDFAGLANNHTLDFEEEGLRETVSAVEKAGVKYAGAVAEGEDVGRPAVLTLDTGLKIHVYAASDHPKDWTQVRQFNLIDYTPATRERLKRQLTTSGEAPPALKIFSVHWGPNYSWQPAQQIQDLAHFLIDECRVDVVHGHSSHHIQGVELYNGKPIIYGCGDFVDDYALVEDYRNDLSAVWRVVVEEQGEERLNPIRLEVFPSKITRFQADLLDAQDNDHKYVVQKVTELSNEFGTKVRAPLGEQGQVVILLNDTSISE